MRSWQQQVFRWIWTAVAICFVWTLGYWGQRLALFQQQDLTQMEQRLGGLYQEIETQSGQINRLNVELEVEKMAAQQTQEDLKSAHVYIEALKTELSFYRKIMKPESEINGVVIDNFALLPTASDDVYRYRLVLTQLKRSKRYAKGNIKLTLVGSKDNKPVKINLMELAGLSNKDAGFSFQYFRVFEGQFNLPQSLTPEAVAIEVTFPKTRWQKYGQIKERVDWSLQADT